MEAILPRVVLHQLFVGVQHNYDPIIVAEG